jgi:hypothetical protein
VADVEPKEPARDGGKTVTEDDRRAQAAAANRKRALDDWEEKKKRWRQMGVPAPLPAKK